MEIQIKNIMNQLILSNATPGINYIVIKDNENFIGSLGLRTKYDENLSLKKEVNTIDTIYDIASLTKVVCTLPIIFRLYEQGKLDLNDRVQKYLPQFKHNKITIYDLLTHTSGLPADLKSKQILTKQVVLDKVYSLDLETEKGTFLYSDIGYIFLGLIIEKICNKPLDKVFSEEVTIPLEMNNTSFCPKNKDIIAPTEITKERGVVRGIVHDEKAASLNGVAGNAGVFSNISDLSNFTLMILNKGIFKGKSYLNEQTLEKWFNPNVYDRNYKRSFSWFVGDNPNVVKDRGNNIISFSGFTGPSISIDRENNIIIIMLTNRIHPTRDNKLNAQMRSVIANEIYDALKLNPYQKREYK